MSEFRSYRKRCNYDGKTCPCDGCQWRDYCIETASQCETFDHWMNNGDSWGTRIPTQKRFQLASLEA